MNGRRLPAAIGLTLLAGQLYAAEPMKTESFDFRFDGKRMSGTLDLPADRPPSAIVVFVLGHGKTDVVAGRWYFDLRSRFVEAGLGCYLWDGRVAARARVNTTTPKRSRAAPRRRWRPSRS
jgi:hypothetical protein